jgi:hypothetical protein
MRTETYGRWWLHEKYVPDGALGVNHDDDFCDHRYFVGELNIGWTFWTPAGRLETIERMEPVDTTNVWWRIWTKETGPDWSWSRRADDRVHAVQPNPIVGPHLRLVELKRSVYSGASMHLVPAKGLELIPDFNLTLVEARHLGTGLGWRMTDRPDGGEPVFSNHPTQAKARTAVLAAGRRHAKILKLKIYKEDELAQHF